MEREVYTLFLQLPMRPGQPDPHCRPAEYYVLIPALISLGCWPQKINFPLAVVPAFSACRIASLIPVFPEAATNMSIKE